MNTPIKPFPTYKWRWLSVEPSEGLLKAPVFLGVLRALQRHEGELYSSFGLHRALKRVCRDTGTDINLARTRERNLVRNSGQYWRGTGLVANSRGTIRLTNLGHNVASGQITNDDFAALIIRNTVLPNSLTYKKPKIQEWENVGLRIKPLELILAIMDKLGRDYCISQAFLSPNELIHVLIPLAGEKASITSCAQAIYEFRNGHLDISSWPNCAPRSNDKRLAREFLLFLENFGICRTDSTANRYEQKFYLDQILSNNIRPDEHRSFQKDYEITDNEIENSRDSEIPIIIERKRVKASLIDRPGQDKFRKGVLVAGGNRCILTQETTLDVLEAAHIIPVEHGGTDRIGNGLCMRVDIHRLYDRGKIRIEPDGSIKLNKQIETTISYSHLPPKIIFPSTVAMKNIEWRSRYL